ncbi:asparagine synthase (glutamine-hydrolyzing) [Patescibacteria group bacterium AH-259-L07]|nr:asparagine synthase (glutamine-hydrolyzing) [Patescibacteria group bacterium AH-259-L07]
MCGICGKWSFNGQPITQSEIGAMNQRLRHRGPDDEGVYTNGEIGLGQTRLAIIDLSPAGNQPMMNEDKSIWIVFNGEIYNFQQLRQLLKATGHQFRSRSDTEVIIHAYEEYGIEGCLKRLRGMFAFAIWDKNEQKLILARDRIGKKPLKYYLDNQGLIFASELKAILTDPRVKVAPDYQAIDWYLTHQYIPAPRTGFVKIKKLPQAHYLVCQNKQIRIKRYWDLDYQPDYTLSTEEWHRRIIDKLDEAVRLRMVADVPLGAFLSGGVDSSAVVASMALQSTRPVKTFSIGFRQNHANELPFARKIAKLYKTDHRELIVEHKGVEILPKLVYHYEEPYADSSALPSYYLAELTKNYVTVALNGDGGDEAFFGYTWYRKLNNLRKLEPLSGLSRLLVPIAQQLYYYYPTTFLRKALVAGESFSYPVETRHMVWTMYVSRFEKQWLYSQDFLSQVSPSPVFNSDYPGNNTHPLNRAALVAIYNYLADDLVVKVDIASMAVALETRSPLLDHELLELAATIPPEMKLIKNEQKSIFKSALKKRLPDTILYRKKHGFSIPVDDWLRDALKEWSHDILLDARTIERGLFNSRGIEKLLRDHANGRINHGQRIWALIMLELWFRQFIDQKNHG